MGWTVHIGNGRLVKIGVAWADVARALSVSARCYEQASSSSKYAGFRAAVSAGSVALHQQVVCSSRADRAVHLDVWRQPQPQCGVLSLLAGRVSRQLCAARLCGASWRAPSIASCWPRGGALSDRSRLYGSPSFGHLAQLRSHGLVPPDQPAGVPLHHATRRALPAASSRQPAQPRNVERCWGRCITSAMYSPTGATCFVARELCLPAPC